MKVLYFINYAPNYRDVFLKELGKHVDLTVVSYAGKEANLKDPEKRVGYKYICLKRKRFLKINFNTKEFTLANGDYDVVIVGYTLWNPFRMINLFRRKKRVIAEGLIYGNSNNIITKLLRRWYLNAAEGVLVYSKMVKDRLEKETSNKIISFNNTSFSKNNMEKLRFTQELGLLNILWVGRYRPGKKIERLINIAERNPKVHIRIIGVGVKEVYNSMVEDIDNVTVLDPLFENELKVHYQWCHAVFNPGGAGLLVMNTARYARPIIIDEKSYHGPEIQLAKEAGQIFVDFNDIDKIDKMIDEFVKDKQTLQEMGLEMFRKMENYTIENMVEKYLLGINNQWNER